MWLGVFHLACLDLPPTTGTSGVGYILPHREGRPPLSTFMYPNLNSNRNPDPNLLSIMFVRDMLACFLA